MAEKFKIRLASEADYAGMLGIYGPYIAGTSITFENVVPPLTEFEARIRKIQQKYPCLVCEMDGVIAGYTYASQYKERVAYDWSVELAAYVQPSYQGKRVGRGLCGALLEVLKLLGYFNAYACVAMPNPKSEGMIRSFGFKEIGTFEKVGNKFGLWHDIKWFGLSLMVHKASPEAPKGIWEVADSDEFRGICEKAEALLVE